LDAIFVSFVAMGSENGLTVDEPVSYERVSSSSSQADRRSAIRCRARSAASRIRVFSDGEDIAHATSPKVTMPRTTKGRRDRRLATMPARSAA
jgi:hypothetical protein